MLSIAVDREVCPIEGRAAPVWHVLSRLEKTAIGRRASDGVTTVRRSEPGGCLLFGPYWQLPSGAYRLEFHCRSGKPRLLNQPVLGVEVIALNRFQLAWLDLTAMELRAEAAALDFSIPAALGLGAGDEARLEFRFFHMGNADLTITSVDLRSLEASKAQPAVARRWRMLGRLQKTAIAKRGGEALRVRRRARAGCVLKAGRPFLQLPEGGYRLSFRCDAGVPRMAAQPVLGVEVIARRRWQDRFRQWGWNSLRGRLPTGELQLVWRDFTAAELRSGMGSLDVAVPAGLGLEGAQDLVIDIRFFHLANADLTIGAVELEQVAQKPATLVPPPRWRLLGLAKGKIGGRDGNRVRLPRSERAGCCLYGGRPRLQLPPGRYRLSLCCRVRLLRSVSAPVLQIEVIARSRGWPLRSHSSVQATRNFTSDELTAERGVVDFEVPPELSREANAQVNFEFRFLHSGDAGLDIDAVSLQQIPNGEEPNKVASLSSIGASKTNVLIIGNCQAQTVYEGLARASELNGRLNARYHFVGLQQNLHELGKIELESSDVLLVQDIRDWENYPLRPYIREGARVVKFPLLHFASLWPFDHYNGPGDKEAYEREWPNLTFLYHDGLLARLRREIPDPEQRLAAYRSLSVEGVINFLRLHDFERRRLIAMDKQFGLQIGQFILSNFQRKRLFYTTNHPNAQIAAMLMQYLLGHLGINQTYRPTAILDHLKRLQVPVHPKVAKALGVKWAGERTKYHYDGEQITWETYVRRYIKHYG